ncbi:hypothetical protein Tco_0475199 [Tanacetum coccineum]
MNEPHIPYTLEFVLQMIRVTENGGRMPLLPHGWKLSFYNTTIITRIEEIDENLTVFKIEPFTLLLDTNEEYQENDAVDVLGTVVGIGDVVAVNSAGMKPEKSIMAAVKKLVGSIREIEPTNNNPVYRCEKVSDDETIVSYWKKATTPMSTITMTLAFVETSQHAIVVGSSIRISNSTPRPGGRPHKNPIATRGSAIGLSNITPRPMGHPIKIPKETRKAVVLCSTSGTHQQPRKSVRTKSSCRINFDDTDDEFDAGEVDEELQSDRVVGICKGKPPMFAQLYIYDTETRLQTGSNLQGRRERDGKKYDLPTAFEVAALIVGDFDATEHKRDIILERQSGDMK